MSDIDLKISLPPGGRATWSIDGVIVYDYIAPGTVPPTPIPPTPIPPIPPTPPTNPGAIQPALAWGEVRQQQMQASGTVLAFPVTSSQMGRASIAFTQGQQPATAAGTITEFTVSRTPGVIDPTAGKNYWRGPSPNNNNITIFTRTLPQYGWVDANSIPDAFAPADQGPWYINVRWAWGATPPWGYCGFSLQWAEGAW